MFLFCVVTLSAQARHKDSLLVMFWNLENFFDWNSQESMPGKYWTKSRFYSKCNLVAKSVFWTAENCKRMPDLIGLAEVENKAVLKRLLSSTLLRKYDYEIVHFDSDDRRGIDVAVLYRISSLELISTSLKTPFLKGSKFQTRDMLHCRMKRRNKGDTLDFIVCHHPSKYGGEKISKERRDAAMYALSQLCDSLGVGPKVVMGDFNDVPDADQFCMIDHLLCNKSVELFQKGMGTIRYKGKWEMIDMFLVDESLDSNSEMNILQIPFLMTYEKKYPGKKPLRTYSGPRYLGGVSDHCPIVLNIIIYKD